MNVIIDKEVNLNTDDLLQTKVYAETLQDLILTAPVSESLTIGLFGPWGSGKSSIIKTLKTSLVPELKLDQSAEDTSKKKWSFKDLLKAKDKATQAPVKPANIKFVVYDAWKYANDSFRRTFILTIQKELDVKPSLGMKNFYSSSTEEKGVRFKFNIPFLILVVFTLGMAVYTYSRVLNPAEEGKHTFPLIVSLLSFFAVVFSKTFLELKHAVQHPVLSAPEQFESCFNEIVTAALKKEEAFWYRPSFLFKVGPAFDKIVIVIDNIDRCPKEAAYELLTNTKNFIDSKLNVVFLIPMDEEALKNHLFKSDSSVAEQSEEFLRKYFNVIVRLKRLRNSEIFDFSAAINEQNEMGLQRDTVNIIAKEYARNPRRIIQFYNNLAVELKMMESKYSKKFSRTYEAAICKFLIIREEWPNQYKEICDHPKAFLDSDPALKIEIASKPFALNSYEVFIDSTYVITRNLGLIVLQKILMNADNYEEIPQTILDASAKGDRTEINKALKDANLSEEKVLNHLLFSLKTAVGNELYETDVTEIMHQFSGLMMAFPRMSRSFLNRLEEFTRRHLQKIVPASKSFKRFAEFNQYALNKKSAFLDMAITVYFQGFVFEQDKTYIESDFVLYREYLYAGQETQIKKATNFFPKYLNSAIVTDKIDPKLKDFKLDLLYDQAVLIEFFFDSNVPAWEDTNYQNWIYFLKNQKNPTPLLSNLLGNAGRSLERATIDERKLYISKYLQLFKEIPKIPFDVSNIDQLHRINDHIFIRPRLSGSQSYIERVPPEESAELFEYLMESYRLTQGSESSAGWIKEFVKIFTLPGYTSLLGNFILKYKKALNLKNLTFLVTEVESVDMNIHSLQMAVCYLSYEGKPIFTDQELGVLLNKLIKGVTDYPDYQVFINDHFKEKRAEKLIRVSLAELQDHDFEKLPKAVRDMKTVKPTLATKK